VTRSAAAGGLPDPRRAACFEFLGAEYDPQRGLAELAYRFDAGPVLVERISFPAAPWPADPAQQSAFRRALALLHGVAGVSYYKAGLSPEIRYGQDCGLGKLGVGHFLQELYVDGLAEFGHVNQLDVASRVRFPESGDEATGPGDSLELPRRALVAMGGGKDSLVGLELLRGAAVDVLPACVGASTLIERTVRAAGLPLLRIHRELAPELAAMNRAGAWNGHVPVTAINSLLLICAALLYGYRYVVFANERSADEATLHTADGRAINHQYSKTYAFERLLRAVLERHVAPGVEYFSIVRPFAELGVLQRFAELTRYHDLFSSCNRNFHLDGPRLSGRWCRDCPKCRFAALGLALFLAPNEVARIQGGALLDDAAQLDGFRALCELGHDKPFECVGEAAESRAALRELARRPAWRELAVPRLLEPELRNAETPALEELLQPVSRHFLPEWLSRRLDLPGAQLGRG